MVCAGEMKSTFPIKIWQYEACVKIHFSNQPSNPNIPIDPCTLLVSLTKIMEIVIHEEVTNENFKFLKIVNNATTALF